MPERKLIIYCDESAAKGRYYSHFYGGALINARHKDTIERELLRIKAEQNLGAELKWTKITWSYREKYLEFVKAFFDFIEADYIKVRIMFTQNSNKAVGLDEQQLNNEYWLLYYQLVKHAFGLTYCGIPHGRTRVTLYLDDVPDKREHFEVFKNYIAGLSSNPRFIAQRVYIPHEEIADVDSKKHVILQGLDIVLGSMNFRLNDLHLERPAGKRQRSKRTRAKAEIYEYINRRVRNLYPNFNVGVSTAIGDDFRDRWVHPYRHWLFVPSESEVIVGVGKPRNKKAPRAAT